MPPAPSTCDLATFTITVNGDTTTFVVPAYTRTPASFNERVADLLAKYNELSEQLGSRPSMADFAMWLLTHASVEPRTQDKDG